MRQATRVTGLAKILDAAPNIEKTDSSLKPVSKILTEAEWRVMTLGYGVQEDITKTFGRARIRSIGAVGRHPSLHMQPKDVIATEALAKAKLQAYLMHNMDYTEFRALVNKARRLDQPVYQQ